MRRSMSFGAAAMLVAIALSSCATAPPEPVEIRLSAASATLTTSEALVLEENDGIPNVGWWQNTDDLISWELEVPYSGDYLIAMQASCDPEFPGSTVVVTVGDQSLELTVRDTGDWLNYSTMEFGVLSLDKGTYTLSLQASNVVNRFVGNVRRVSVVSQ